SETQFDKYLGYYCAAFTIADYPHRNEGTYTSYSVLGKQIARYALRGGRTAFLIVFAENEKLSVGHHDAAAQKEIVRERFRGQGWECDEILSAMDRSGDFYFDSASQIRMPHWSKGRVALLGDACFCPSLIAGQGSALAMAGAYILAGELKEAKGDHRVAFANYERIFSPFILEKQKGAQKFANSFAPKTHFGLLIRNRLSGLLSIPFIAHWTIGRLIEDRLKLADYSG
ncbi:MAG: FAD-binding domain, partial [bacterium]